METIETVAATNLSEGQDASIYVTPLDPGLIYGNNSWHELGAFSFHALSSVPIQTDCLPVRAFEIP